MNLIDLKIKSKDGVELSGHAKITESKNIILIVHGFGEHIKRYKHVFDFFGNNGFSVIGFDLRGHGSSAGRKGHIKNYSDLLDDIDVILEFLKNEYKPKNIIVYGHSTGGAILLNYILNKKNNGIQAAIIASPWIELFKSSPMYPLAKIMAKIIPVFSSSANLNPDELMSGRSFKEIHLQDKKLINKMSASALVEFVKWGKGIINNIDDLKVNTLLMHGTEDRITKFESSKLLSEINHSIDFKEWIDYRHELHNEENWEEVLNYTLGWINNNIK